MSRTIQHTNEDKSFHPISLDSDFQWAGTNGTESNMFNYATNTSYYQINFTTGSNAESWWYLNFDCTEIPLTATINSASLRVKIYRSGNNSQIATKTVQLYADTTAKGTAYTIPGSTTTAFSPDSIGTWTAAELNGGVKMKAYIKRGTAGTTSNYYARVYGVTFTVNASWEEVQYQTTVSNQSQNQSSITTTVSSEYTTYGQDVTVTINNVQNVNTIGVFDNGNNVAMSLVHTTGNTYTYTINGIAADHAIVVRDVTSYNVTVSSNTQNVSALEPVAGTYQVGEGIDFSIKVYTQHVEDIAVYDNDTNRTSTLTYTEPSYTGVQSTLIPSSNSNTGGTVTNAANGQTNSASDTYATFEMARNSSGELVYAFDLSSIPSNAIITSISGNVKATITSTATAVKTKKFEARMDGTMFAQRVLTSTTAYVYNFSESLNTSKPTTLQLAICLECGNTTVSVYFYGADFTITYDYDGEPYYLYVSSNINEAHTIVFSDASVTPTTKFYKKVNGSWVEVTLYKKSGGIWSAVTDISELNLNTLFMNAMS